MQLFGVVTGHRKPERDGPVGVAEIDSDQRVVGACVAREQQNSALLIAIPIVEEEVRALTNVVALPRIRSSLRTRLTIGRPDSS